MTAAVPIETRIGSGGSACCAAVGAASSASTGNRQSIRSIIASLCAHSQTERYSVESAYYLILIFKYASRFTSQTNSMTR